MKKFLSHLSQTDCLSFFLKLSLLGAVGLGTLDIIRYPGFVANNLGISAIVVAMGVALVHLFIRYKWRISLGETTAKNLMVLFPVGLAIAFFMYFSEEGGGFYPNFYFFEFSIHYLGISGLSLILLLFGLAHSTKNIWQKYYLQINLVMTAVVLIGAFFLHLHYPLTYKTIIREDHLVEYLTALSFLLAGLLCFSLPGKLLPKIKGIKWQENALRGLLYLASAAFLLVAGEEISWGQRLLGFATPENIEIMNRQGEVNLHNLETFWPFVYLAYLWVGAIGASLWLGRWLIQDLLPQNKRLATWLNLMVPSGYLMLNFSLIVLYVLLRSKHGVWRYSPWEELSELVLSLGILIHLANNRWRNWHEKN